VVFAVAVAADIVAPFLIDVSVNIVRSGKIAKHVGNTPP
jgi:hypothetical protein